MNRDLNTLEEEALRLKYNKIYYDKGFREGSGFGYSRYNRYTPKLYNYMKDIGYINSSVKHTSKEKLFEKFLLENELTSEEEQLEYIKFLKLKYGEAYNIEFIY